MAGHEAGEQHQHTAGETIAVQADAELVGAKPTPGGDDVASDGKQRKPAGAQPAIPPCVERGRVPEHDHQGTVLLRIPTPEAAPAVVSPEAAEHRADEAEEEGEADHAIRHAIELIFVLPRRQPLLRSGCGPAVCDSMDDRKDAEHSGEEGGAVAERNGDHVRGEPELRVEHGLQDVHRVTRIETIGHHERERSADCRHEIADAVGKQPLQPQPRQHTGPADEHRGGIEIHYRRAAREVDAAGEGERVEQEDAHEHPEHEAVQRPPAGQKARKADDRGQHVEPLGEIRGIEAVEPGLVGCLVDDGTNLGKRGRGCLEGVERPVEIGRCAGHGSEHLGERQQAWVDLEGGLAGPA